MNYDALMLLSLVAPACAFNALPLLRARSSTPQSIQPIMQIADAPPPVPVPPVTFEAQGDPVQAVLLFFVVALPFGYWWYITVPEARLALAKDKRLQDGDTNQYLKELAADDSPRPVERWFFSKWLNQLRPARATPRAPEATGTDAVAVPAPADGREAAPTSDEVPATAPQPDVTLGELFAPASLKGNATPKFFSGDNPIVVTVSTLLALGIFATIARENSALAVDGAVLTAGILFGVTRLNMK